MTSDENAQLRNLHSFEIGQELFVLRSNASWDEGWIVKDVDIKSVTLYKNKMSKRFYIEQAKLFTKPASKSRPHDPSLCEGVILGDCRLFNKIIARSPDCNIPEEVQGREEYPLLLAVRQNQLEMVKTMLLNGADTTVGDQNGQSPIHLAAANDNVSVLKALLDCGANLDAKDNSGKNALHLAVLNDSERAISFLIENSKNLIFGEDN
ncbi:hypothetical protein MHBO_002291, partial [Bonamia ostreae]